MTTTTNTELRHAATTLRNAFALYPEMRGVGIGIKDNKPCLRVSILAQTEMMKELPSSVEGIDVVIFDVSQKTLPVEQRPVSDTRLHLMSEHGRGDVLWMPEDTAEALHASLHGISDVAGLSDTSWDYKRAYASLEAYRQDRKSGFDPANILEQYFHHR